MKRWSAFLERLPGKRRPPTGPLTTEETATAEELRQTLAKDAERIERDENDANDRADHQV